MPGTISDIWSTEAEHSSESGDGRPLVARPPQTATEVQPRSDAAPEPVTELPFTRLGENGPGPWWQWILDLDPFAPATVPAGPEQISADAVAPDAADVVTPDATADPVTASLPVTDPEPAVDQVPSPVPPLPGPAPDPLPPVPDPGPMPSPAPPVPPLPAPGPAPSPVPPLPAARAPMRPPVVVDESPSRSGAMVKLLGLAVLLGVAAALLLTGAVLVLALLFGQSTS